MTIPLHPPAAWFDHPGEIPTDKRLTITPEGRVYGYVKLRGSCHAGAPGCLEAPDDSKSEFGFAHQGETMTAEGGLLATANIGGGRHADMQADILTAAAHYQEGVDNQLMRVRYGSDPNGIWFSGALWPDADPLTVEHIRASPVSGDWRWVSYQRAHDFAGATLVNIPGYAMANAGDARTAHSSMQAIAASASSIVVDSGGNISAMYARDESNGGSPMCQSNGTPCSCQTAPAEEAAPPVTAALVKPCTCGKQTMCDNSCGKYPVTAAAAEAEAPVEVSFADAVVMKIDELCSRIGKMEDAEMKREATRMANEIIE